MKPYLIILALAITFVSSCYNDNPNTPREFFRQEPGWVIDAVVSDFQSKATAAINGTSESVFTANGTTRTEISASYNAQVEQTVSVDDCDRDDLLIYVGLGTLGLDRGPSRCPGADDPTVLGAFADGFFSINNSYDSIHQQTFINNIRDPRTYLITELTRDKLRFSGTHIVRDSIIGDFTYEIEYALILG